MNPEPEPVSDLNLRSPAVLDDPHPVYDRLREHAPAHWNASLGGWILARHADVRRALLDERLSVAKMGRFEARRSGGEGHADIAFLARTLADWMVFNDPPRHRELRRAMQNAFLARDVPVLEGNVRTVVDELLDPLGPEGRMDLVADFAHPLPAIVVAELFGMPRKSAGSSSGGPTTSGGSCSATWREPDKTKNTALRRGPRGRWPPAFTPSSRSTAGAPATTSPSSSSGTARTSTTMKSCTP